MHDNGLLHVLILLILLRSDLCNKCMQVKINYDCQHQAKPF